MQSKVHRAITKQIANLLDPNRGWGILIAASDEPDWHSSGKGHHRRLTPTEDIEEIVTLICDARQEHLVNAYSDMFQTLLGKAFHYIQDRFIQSSDKSLHARYEAAISRALPSLVPWAKPVLLEGEEEILLYLRKTIKFIDDPQEILYHAFVTCLSVGKAICENKRGFQVGVNMNQFAQGLDHGLSALYTESNRSIEIVNNELSQVISLTKARYDSSCTRYIERLAKRTSLFRTMIAVISLQDWRYRRSINNIKHEFLKEIEKIRLQHNREYEQITQNQEKTIVRIIQEMNNILTAQYERIYKARETSPKWYRIRDVHDFKSPKEIRQLIVKAKEVLISIRKDWEGGLLGLQQEQQSVLGSLKPVGKK